MSLMKYFLGYVQLYVYWFRAVKIILDPLAAINIRTFVLFIVKYFFVFLVFLYNLNYISVRFNFCVTVLTKYKVFSKVQFFVTSV